MKDRKLWDTQGQDLNWIWLGTRSYKSVAAEGNI